MQKVAFHTLGCKLNFSETATLARVFQARGFATVSENDAADVYVLNTCSVTEEADVKCRKAVRRFLRRNPSAYIIVVGCYAQLKPQEIADIPGVDAVLGAAEKFRLFEFIDDFTKGPRAQVHRCAIDVAQTFTPGYSLDERTRAFLKVQDGCDYKCSFCTIPLARGKSRSDAMENVLNSAKELGARGVKEIVLTGVNIGDYEDDGRSFYDLIRALDDEVTNVPRFRISSIEPNLLTDEIIAFVAKSRAFMPHFHVPLQSGSNNVLSAMRRRYKRELYRDRVHLIKELMPQAAIGCDVIVGFPTETENDFEETRDFILNLPVTYLHVFPFSPRAQTPAADAPNLVSSLQKAARAQILRELSLKKSRFFYSEFIGTTRPALFERATDGTFLEGFTDNYLKVRVPYAPERINAVLSTELTDWDGEILYGKVVVVGE